MKKNNGVCARDSALVAVSPATPRAIAALFRRGRDGRRPPPTTSATTFEQDPTRPLKPRASPATAELTEQLEILSTSANAAIYNARINGIDVKVLIDSGATRSFVNKARCDAFKLAPTPLQETTRVVLGDGGSSLCTAAATASVEVADSKVTMTLRCMPLVHDVILGQDWLQTVNPYIDWRSGELIIRPTKRPIIALQTFQGLDVLASIDDDDNELLLVVHLNSIHEDHHEQHPELQALLNESRDVFYRAATKGTPTGKKSRPRNRIDPWIDATTSPTIPPITYGTAGTAEVARPPSVTRFHTSIVITFRSTNFVC